MRALYSIACSVVLLTACRREAVEPAKVAGGSAEPAKATAGAPAATTAPATASNSHQDTPAQKQMATAFAALLGKSSAQEREINDRLGRLQDAAERYRLPEATMAKRTTGLKATTAGPRAISHGSGYGGLAAAGRSDATVKALLAQLNDPNRPSNAQLYDGYAQAALSGDEDSTRFVATMKEFGIGTTQDFSEAAKLYKWLADNGDPTATVNLARLYSAGNGVPQDYQYAYDLLGAAWQQAQDPDAAFLLGSSFLDGWAGEKDPKTAVRWLKAAADAGQTDAMLLLGSYLRTGTVVDKDPALADAYFLRAAQAGAPEAMVWEAQLASLPGGNKTGKSELEWLQQAADLEYTPAYPELAKVSWFQKLQAGNRDIEPEIALMRKAGETGYTPADLTIAFFQYMSDPQNGTATALDTLRNGNALAQYAATLIDSTGMNVEQAYLEIQRRQLHDADNLTLDVYNQKSPGGPIPTPKYMQEPDYPAGLAADGTGGVVKIMITVDEQGVPQDLTVLESQHPLLSQAALEAVAKWRFTPGHDPQTGQPITVKMVLPVIFRVSGSRSWADPNYPIQPASETEADLPAGSSPAQ